MGSNALTTNNSNFKRILASYLEPESISLTPAETELKTRYEAAFSLLLNWRSREQAVKILEGQFNISKATAYRDINRALSLFGDITKSSKEGWRYVTFEYNQKLFQMATKEKNLEAMGKCIDRMIKLAQLDQVDSEVDPDKLQAQNYSIVLPKSMQKSFELFMKKGGPIDLNGFNAEDTDYEEIK